MSSPGTIYGPPSSPPVPPSITFDDADEDAMPDGRPMRVKILYTFDDDNKTNCLARFPHALNIPTVALDNNTQIGVIELKKCIEAIVNASPELVAKLGQDYTVYAYDYSEYETPLVGQGMLSWVLASTSSTPNAPAHQSSTMITGRVCKNIMGLFSNGVKETLEVKLRLVPVPTCLQSEYLASLERYRSASGVLPSNLETGEWDSDGGQPLPDLGSTDKKSTHQTGGIEDIHHLLTQGHNARGNRAISRDHGHPMSDAGYSSQASRAGSPTPSQRSNSASQIQTRYPPLRPSSRASVASNRSSYSRKGNTSSFERRDVQDSDQQEEPAKKKARIVKADWKGKSSALGSADSLRVTASTANSIRVHRPVSVRPSGDRTHSLEPPPRAPTPIPEASARSRPLLRTASTSLLRRGSTLSNDGRYSSPYAPDETPEQSQPAWAFSPQDENRNSVNTSPSDIPSSPPEFAPSSSPPLPTYPPDSGFMSGLAMDRADNDNEERAIDEEDIVVAKQWRRRPKTMRPDKEGFCEVIPGPVELLPQRMPEKLHELERQRRLQEDKSPNDAHQPERSTTTQEKQAPAHIAAGIPPPSERKASTTSLVLPTSGTSLEGGPPSRSCDLQRSSSCATSLTGTQETRTSPQITAEEVANEKSSASAAASRRRIANRLAESLAKGQSPPYCQNCGEINTPTWRTAFCKIEEGQMPEVTYSGAKGAISALQSLEQDGHGRTTRYMVIKKVIDDKVETDYRPFQLCNPCGLWLNKLKGMRPQKVWHKSSNDRRRREFLKKMQQAGSVEPQSDFGPTTASMLYTDQISPEESSDLRQSPVEPPSRDGPTEKRPESNATQIQEQCAVSVSTWDDAFAATALQRAIQSSPARFLGSKKSPIELGEDLTPKPTRRLLFPSPRREGEMKTLDGSRSSPINHASHSSTENGNPIVTLNDAQNDKENRPPPLDAGDDLDNIFQDINFPLLKTPEKKARSPITNNSFKTPTPASRRKLPLSPGNLLNSANRALRSTPSSNRGSASRLLQTLLSPSLSKEHQQLTPFTTQLNQLLSDSLSSPSRNYKGFDFETLPSLDFNEEDLAHFASGFDPDFFSTDPVMPSSPPPALTNPFGVYEDPVDGNNAENGEQGWDAESLFGKSPGAGSKDKEQPAGGMPNVLDGEIAHDTSVLHTVEA